MHKIVISFDRQPPQLELALNDALSADIYSLSDSNTLASYLLKYFFSRIEIDINFSAFNANNPSMRFIYRLNTYG